MPSDITKLLLNSMGYGRDSNYELLKVLKKLDDKLSKNDQFFTNKGRIISSGMGSKINWQEHIESLMSVDQKRLDQVQEKISAMDAKNYAYQTLKNKITALKNSASLLYGKSSNDNTGNVFNSKVVSGTVTTAGVTSSPFNNILDIAAGEKAVLGSHSLKVTQKATYEQIASKALTNDQLSNALNLTGNLSFSNTQGGDIVATINVVATDTVKTIAAKINNSNAGISATINHVSDNQNYLVLTSKTTSQPIYFDGSSLSALLVDSLGISDGAIFNGTYNVISGIKTKIFATDADTVLNISGTLALTATQNGAAITTIAVTTGDSLSSIANKINSDMGAQGAGITATAVSDFQGYTYLKITKANGPVYLHSSSTQALVQTNLSMSDGTVTNNAYGILSDKRIGGQLLTTAQNSIFSIDNLPDITRPTNAISDVIEGVTFSINKSDPTSVIDFDIKTNISAIKDGIVGFVNAYNDAKTFLNEQSQWESEIDPKTGQNVSKPSENAILARELPFQTIARSVEDIINRFIGTSTSNDGSDVTSLSNIGITFVDNKLQGNNAQTDLSQGTLVIDELTLEKSLLDNVDGIKDLFAFNFSSNIPELQFSDINGPFSPSSTGLDMKVSMQTATIFNSKYYDNATTALNLSGTFSFANSANGAELFNIQVAVENNLTDIANAITQAGTANGISASVFTNVSGQSCLSISRTQDGSDQKFYIHTNTAAALINNTTGLGISDGTTNQNVYVTLPAQTVLNTSIKQVQMAANLRSRVYDSTSTALNLAGTLAFTSTRSGGALFNVNILVNDTLQGIADKINASGAASGISASISQNSQNKYYLKINRYGQEFFIDSTTTANLIEGLGISDGTNQGGIYNTFAAQTTALRSASATGRLITIGNGIVGPNANMTGLRIYWDRPAGSDDVHINYTSGVAASTQGIISGFLSPNAGLLDRALTDLSSDKSSLTSELSRKQEALELKRERLIERFTRMETIYTKLKQTIEDVKIAFGNKGSKN